MITTTQTKTMPSDTTIKAPPPYLQLRVLTNAGIVLEEDEAVSVIAPGGLGYVGVLKHHAQLVTTLVPGTLTWKTSIGQTRQARTGHGLLEIEHNRLLKDGHNRLTILTDAFLEVTSSQAELH